MKIALVSGFLNDHLLPICEELNKKCEFNFIATQDTCIQGTQYKQIIERDYVLHYNNQAQRDEVINKILQNDVVIFGGSSSELLKIRKQTNKLSFIYTERFFKKGAWRRFIPTTANLLKNQYITNAQSTYVLCSGSFVAKDLKLIGFDTTKCFKFGYFPNANFNTLENSIAQKDNTPIKLLFVGKLIKIKRVIDVFKCCNMLKTHNIPFELNVIGDGPERKSLEKYANTHKLSTIKFHGGKPKETVFQFMQQSNLCFVASDRREGWAAVINEALSQACPVIASNTCGATAYLIKNNVNGFSYKVGSIKELYTKTTEFINNTNRESYYTNAYNTIQNEWNATIAIERFLEISKAILKNQNTDLYESGPLSKC